MRKKKQRNVSSRRSRTISIENIVFTGVILKKFMKSVCFPTLSR